MTYELSNGLIFETEAELSAYKRGIEFARENANISFDTIANNADMSKINKKDIIGKLNEEKAGFSEYVKQKVKQELFSEGKNDPCWDGYEQFGMKDKDGKKVPNCVKKEDEELVTEEADVLFEEDGTPYYMELCEETLEERKIHIKVNSKGQRIRKIRCGPGKVAKNIGGRVVCVVPSGSEKLTKKLAIRRSVRTKNAKGTGYKKRTNFKRNKAMRKRRAMGLK